MQNLTIVQAPKSKYTHINNHVYFYKDDNYCYIYIHHNLWFKYELNDYLNERFSIVSLYLNKICSQKELSEAFDIHRNSISNWVSDYKESGILGLVKLKTTPKSKTKITLEIRDFILSFDHKHPDITYNYVVEKIKEKYDVDLHASTVGDVVQGRTHDDRFTLFDNVDGDEKDEKETTENNIEQCELNFDSQKETQEDLNPNDNRKNMDKDVDKTNNEKPQESSSHDRVEKQLQTGLTSRYGAALVLTPFIQKLNIIDILKETITNCLDIDFDNCFYGIEELIKTLIFLIIFQFPSFEQFKTVSAKEFGPLIGYDRAPSVKVLRERMDDIAQLDICNHLMDKFARQYLKCGLIDIGVLYLDGHPVPYYGRNNTPKKYFSTRNLAMKGDQHIYINGKQGRPFIFKFNDASKKFIDVIPEIADDAKELITQETEHDAPLILVFDREPYSASLFQELDEKGYIFVSWRKWDKKVSLDKFKETVEWRVDKNTTLTYHIYRRQISIGRKRHPVEAISFYCEENFDPDNDKPSTLVTNAGKFNPDDYMDYEDLSSFELIKIMCGRWKQENFFKTMKNHYFIDYHPDYQFEELLPQPMVKNPALKEVEKEIRKLKRERAKVLKKLGEKFTDSKYNDKSLEHYQNLKTSNKWIKQRDEIDNKLKKLKAKKKQLPKKVPFDNLSEEKMMYRTVRRKLFFDILKTAIYNMQEMALDSFSQYYNSTKDIRVIMQMLINSTTYLKLENDTLFVSIQQPDQPRYQKATIDFLEELNRLNIQDMNGYAKNIKFELTNVVYD